MTKKKKKTQKILNNGVTEEEFLEVLNNISKRLVHKFRFGYHDIDDMKQQAAIFAMEGLEKFDNTRPLENFLWTHVRNRLFNYKRNNYQRPDKPCLSCPFYDLLYKESNNQCSKYKNKDDCELYFSWSERNNSKKNIMTFQSIENTFEKEDHKDPLDIIKNKEIISYLDNNIVKPEFRENYLRLKNGLKLNKPLLEKLKNHIMELMKDFNHDRE
jgi:hypothetical protein